jgi:hypothetical protein
MENSTPVPAPFWNTGAGARLRVLLDSGRSVSASHLQLCRERTSTADSRAAQPEEGLNGN